MNAEDVIETLSEELSDYKVKGGTASGFVIEKLGMLIVENNRLTEILKRLEQTVDKSELLFSLPEVDLHTRSKLSTIVINAEDQFAIGSNFFELEKSESGNYRWMGPNRLTTFILPIDRLKEKYLRIFFKSEVKKGLFNSIKFYVDGELYPFDLTRVKGGTELMAKLPVSNRVQDTVVGLFIPELFKPSELTKNSQDQRLLSLAFEKLEVF
jgi:hypothetical protein